MEFNFINLKSEANKKEESEAKPKPTDPIEYVKLWMTQSQLFWSRLQTAAAIQTGVFLGWWTLDKTSGYRWVCFPLLGFGVILLVVLFFVMRRDVVYLEKLKDRAGTETFPHATKLEGAGQTCAWIIVWTLIASNFFLAAISFFNKRPLFYE